jgi:uncharacterized membrane protein
MISLSSQAISRYQLLFFTGILYGIISIWYEMTYQTSMTLKDEKQDRWKMIALRLLHSLVITYIYLFPFAFYDLSASITQPFQIYLGIMIFVMLNWIIFECCIISYFEWTNYRVQIQNISNQANPVHNITQRLREMFSFTLDPNIIFVLLILFALVRSGWTFYGKLTYGILVFYLMLIVPFDEKLKPVTIHDCLYRISKYFSPSFLLQRLRSTRT